MESIPDSIEVWKPIEGYEGRYEVSNLGRVKSLAHWQKSKAGSRAYYADRILTAGPGDAGRASVNLCDENGPHRRSVHVLVAEAFLGPRREDQILVRHLDGNAMNNVATNLAYGTYSDNNYDTVRHGTHHHASVTHCPRGHEYDEANTYYRNDRGHRTCRACARIRDEARRRRSRVQPREGHGRVA